MCCGCGDQIDSVATGQTVLVAPPSLERGDVSSRNCPAATYPNVTLASLEGDRAVRARVDGDPRHREAARVLQ